MGHNGAVVHIPSKVGFLSSMFAAKAPDVNIPSRTTFSHPTWARAWPMATGSASAFSVLVPGEVRRHYVGDGTLPEPWNGITAQAGRPGLK